MQYYIIDKDISVEPIIFKTLGELITHLEGAVVRKFKKNRTQYMQHLIELGYGYDDAGGKIFTQSMGEYYNFGIVKQGRLCKCNVHEVELYSKYRTEMGD
jgi:hypothetical protein